MGVGAGTCTTTASTICAPDYVGPNGELHLCYYDPKCHDTTTDPYHGFGCDANGLDPMCRFCGFNATNAQGESTEYPDCPSSPTPPTMCTPKPTTVCAPNYVGPHGERHLCYLDPACKEGGVGCDANGLDQMCRFCGFTATNAKGEVIQYPDCPADMTASDV